MKGFEVKRREEPKMINNLQSQLCRVFQEGYHLEECCYAAGVANQWLDSLYSKLMDGAGRKRDLRSDFTKQKLVRLFERIRSPEIDCEQHGEAFGEFLGG